MNITWYRKTQQYSNGEYAKIGSIRFASVDWDSCSQDKTKKYKITVSLPGISIKETNFETQDEAKKNVESILENWIDSAQLTTK